MTQGTARSAPTRTCVACRERLPTDQLVRLVARSGQLVPDLRRALPGRGAHLCPSAACLDRAAKRQSFRRALRASVRLDPNDLRVTLHRAFEAEAQRIASAPRTSLANQARDPWIQQGLREFTLNNPGAMNRPPANRGQSAARKTAPQQRSENR